MRKFFSVLFLVGLLGVGSATAANKIVFIDMQEIFKQFYKTQLAHDQIRQQAADIKLEQATMEEEIKDLKDEVEILRMDSRDETLSEEVRAGKLDQLEEKLVELQQKEQDMREFGKLREQQLDQQNKRMTLKLFDEINEVINDYAKEQSFDAVIDRSTKGRSGVLMVAYVGPKVDISANIIAILNEGRKDRPKKTEDL